MRALYKKSQNLGSAYLRNERGNVAMIFAFSVIPLLLTGGIAIDYARDAMIRGRLTAVADAAVLTATTPAMLQQSSSVAQAAATKMFAAQAALINGLTYDSTKLTVTITDTSGANGIVRKANVTYAATVNNIFGKLEKQQQTGFTVASTSTISSAPNINFYLMLDSSASMLIPATTAGISTMYSKTGCSLACHESDFKDPENTVQYSGWGTIDTYTYAKNAGVTLRIDNVRTAAQSLVTTAQSTMATYNANAQAGVALTYQMAAYTFDEHLTKLLSLTPTTSANTSTMQSAISTIAPPLMADNSFLPVGGSYTYPTGTGAGSYTTVTSIPTSQSVTYGITRSGDKALKTSPSVTDCSGKTAKSTTVTATNTGLCNDDAGTNFALALYGMNNNMPNPGNGTSLGSDTPQEVLMIVTDGVDDVSLYNSSYCKTSYNWSYTNKYGTFNRCQQPVNTALCSTIKARGIRIAVLYTTYFPITNNYWYNATVDPFISQVPTNLKACASSDQLYTEVSTDGDITAALKQLFINAVQSAPHLIQ